MTPQTTLLAFASMGVTFGGALAYGLWTGAMPGKWGFGVKRSQHPILYWLLGIIWGALTAGCFAAAYSAVR